MCELSEPVRTVLLDLPPKGGPHRKAPRDSVSALALRGDSLSLGSDEGVVLDRLTRAGDDRFGSPRVFPLLDLLDLPNRTGEDDEIDIEGMDIEGDVLWLVGSHSWTRGKPKDHPPRDRRGPAGSVPEQPHFAQAGFLRPATRRGEAALAAAGSDPAAAAGFRPRPIALASAERCAA